MEAAPCRVEGLSDEALMALAADGDQAAFGQIASRFLPRLIVLTARILNSRADAEEIAQEALLRAWTHAASYDPGKAKLSTWLHRIALNAALDRKRASRAHLGIASAEEVASADPSAVALLARAERYRALAEGIAAMPARQRQALLLTYASGQPGIAAAGAMGISTRAVEGLLHRGRHFLRDWLTAREF
jgi:RNA polymerase sigma-70 factor (ECF subfamily)